VLEGELTALDTVEESNSLLFYYNFSWKKRFPVFVWLHMRLLREVSSVHGPLIS
jgi:hypothetical protein